MTRDGMRTSVSGDVRLLSSVLFAHEDIIFKLRSIGKAGSTSLGPRTSATSPSDWTGSTSMPPSGDNNVTVSSDANNEATESIVARGDMLNAFVAATQLPIHVSQSLLETTALKEMYKNAFAEERKTKNSTSSERGDHAVRNNTIYSFENATSSRKGTTQSVQVLSELTSQTDNPSLTLSPSLSGSLSASSYDGESSVSTISAMRSSPLTTSSASADESPRPSSEEGSAATSSATPTKDASRAGDGTNDSTSSALTPATEPSSTKEPRLFISFLASLQRLLHGPSVNPSVTDDSTTSSWDVNATSEDMAFVSLQSMLTTVTDDVLDQVPTEALKATESTPISLSNRTVAVLFDDTEYQDSDGNGIVMGQGDRKLQNDSLGVSNSDMSSLQPQRKTGFKTTHKERNTGSKTRSTGKPVTVLTSNRHPTPRRTTRNDTATAATTDRFARKLQAIIQSTPTTLTTPSKIKITPNYELPRAITHASITVKRNSDTIKEPTSKKRQKSATLSSLVLSEDLQPSRKAIVITFQKPKNASHGNDKNSSKSQNSHFFKWAITRANSSTLLTFKVNSSAVLQPEVTTPMPVSLSGTTPEVMEPYSERGRYTPASLRTSNESKPPESEIQEDERVLVNVFVTHRNETRSLINETVSINIRGEDNTSWALLDKNGSNLNAISKAIVSALLKLAPLKVAVDNSITSSTSAKLEEKLTTETTGIATIPLMNRTQFDESLSTEQTVISTTQLINKTKFEASSMTEPTGISTVSMNSRSKFKENITTETTTQVYIPPITNRTKFDENVTTELPAVSVLPIRNGTKIISLHGNRTGNASSPSQADGTIFKIHNDMNMGTTDAEEQTNEKTVSKFTDATTIRPTSAQINKVEIIFDGKKVIVFDETGDCSTDIVDKISPLVDAKKIKGFDRVIIEIICKSQMHRRDGQPSPRSVAMNPSDPVGEKPQRHKYAPDTLGATTSTSKSHHSVLRTVPKQPAFRTSTNYDTEQNRKETSTKASAAAPKRLPEFTLVPAWNKPPTPLKYHSYSSAHPNRKSLPASFHEDIGGVESRFDASLDSSREAHAGETTARDANYSIKNDKSSEKEVNSGIHPNLKPNLNLHRRLSLEKLENVSVGNTPVKKIVRSKTSPGLVHSAKATRELPQTEEECEHMCKPKYRPVCAQIGAITQTFNSLCHVKIEGCLVKAGK